MQDELTFAKKQTKQSEKHGTAQLIIHGVKDDALSIDLSRRYAATARAAGDSVDLVELAYLVELADAGHMDFLDPHSEAHATLCHWLAHVSQRSPANSARASQMPGSTAGTTTTLWCWLKYRN